MGKALAVQMHRNILDLSNTGHASQVMIQVCARIATYQICAHSDCIKPYSEGSWYFSRQQFLDTEANILIDNEQTEKGNRRLEMQQKNWDNLLNLFSWKPRFYVKNL